MKKLRLKAVSLLIVAVFALGFVAPVTAFEESPRIRVNGEFLAFPGGQPPIIVDGRTLVPLRDVMEPLGFYVEWLGDSLRDDGVYVDIVVLHNESLSVYFGIGLNEMGVTDWGGRWSSREDREVWLEVAPQIVNWRTMVPLRAIAEATGMDVEWDGVNGIVDITTKEDELGPIQRSEITLPNRRLTYAEMAEWINEYWWTDAANEFEREVVRLVNAERTSRGLDLLWDDDLLMMVARFKAQSMADLNYLAHEGVHGSPRDLMREAGIEPRHAAENISRGQATPAEVVQAWMSSSGDRANILNSNFHTIGVGAQADSNGRMTWSLMFNSYY